MNTLDELNAIARALPETALAELLAHVRRLREPAIDDVDSLVRSSVLESIGYLPPRAAEARYHRQVAEQTVTT